ncbi:MAG: hypothetical protein Q7J20_06240 [Candidatus Nitrotoga sp.]|nr:hypothetical protein [Candidatus Nitrotoga sp.]MDO9447481.1 hypothetical protein [Candidatus Nitrotoga sp.]
MLAYNLMSLFRQAVMKSSIHHTLVTLHHKVFAVGVFWDSNAKKNVLRLAVTRRRRQWFEGFGLTLQSIRDCIGSGMNEG